MPPEFFLIGICVYFLRRAGKVYLSNRFSLYTVGEHLFLTSVVMIQR